MRLSQKFQKVAAARKASARAPFFSARVQPELTVNERGDKYEQDAEAMADQVMRMESDDSPQSCTKNISAGALQRKCKECEEEEELQREELEEAMPLMRKSADGGYDASRELSSMLAKSKGGGAPITAQTLGEMNHTFGRDFSNVRVHTDPVARSMSEGIRAKAFTHGSDIYFNSGYYRPEGKAGKGLLAHELTHTIHQGWGSQSGTTPQVQRDEFEPWPGQSGHDVAGTLTTNGDIIREQVQRIGDPTYAQLDPMLLEFNTRTCVLTLRKQLNFVNAGTGEQRLSDAAFRALIVRILEIANEKLNGWVSIRVSGSDRCSLQCEGGKIDVRIVAVEGTGSYSSTIRLHRTFGRENAGNIGEDASNQTIWHEMGHLVLGAADEYPEASRPDATPRPSSRVNESDWSIMASAPNARRAMMHARHFSHLTAWLARRFPDCSFSMNEDSRPIVVELSPIVFMGGFGSSGGHSGTYYSLGLDLGIPLDRLRKLELILGPRLNYLVDFGSEQTHSLLLGFRAGLQGQFAPSGFRLGGFAEGGGVGFTDLSTGEFGARRYLEGGLGLGYSIGGSVDFGLEAAGGGREFGSPIPLGSSGATSDFQSYFRLGVAIGGSF